MLTNRFEEVIFHNLFFNEVYTRRVFAFLDESMFFEPSDKTIFIAFKTHIDKYKNSPAPEAILISCDKNTKINEAHYNSIVDIITRISDPDSKKYDHQLEWLIDETEKFCQEKSIISAILEANDIITKESKSNLGDIPELIKKALSISFDERVGHSYFEDAEEAFEIYNRVETHLPCDLEMINRITKGGVVPKTLNMILGGTNVGKSFVLCHLAASYLSQGLNVLYISLEMDEIGLRERIDANLMNIQIDDVKKMNKAMFLDRVEKIRKKYSGNLYLKEYPTTGANINHFRSLLQEMNLKKNFKPDVILVDYLNIVSSCRFTSSTRGDMYSYIKSVAEELRSLAQEFNVPIWSASQFNREGFRSDEPGLENSSESFGTAMTADLVLSIVRTEELDAMGKIKVKVLKNRYNNTSICRRFTLGFDLSRMKLFDDEQIHMLTTENNGLEKVSTASLFTEETEPKTDLKTKFKNSFVYDKLLEEF